MAAEDAKMRECDVKDKMTVMMMGSREDDINSIAPPAGFDENEIIEEKDWGMEIKSVKEKCVSRRLLGLSACG
jgi:hypothetical protein